MYDQRLRVNKVLLAADRNMELTGVSEKLQEHYGDVCSALSDDVEWALVAGLMSVAEQEDEAMPMVPIVRELWTYIRHLKNGSVL